MLRELLATLLYDTDLHKIKIVPTNSLPTISNSARFRGKIHEKFGDNEYAIN